MKWIRLSSLALLSVFGAAGSACGGATTDPGAGKSVEFRIDRGSYASGDTVAITAVNLSDANLTFPGGFCPQSLERFEQGTWNPALAVNPSAGCPLSIGFLGPKDRLPFMYVLPGDLTAGVYRLMIPAAIPEGQNGINPPIATRAFTVNSSAF